MKEQLKSKERELASMEDELDNKNAEINATGTREMYYVCHLVFLLCWQTL